MKSLKCMAAAAALCGLAIVAPAFAQDNVEGPWGMYNGNIYGHQRSDQIPVIFGTGTGAVEAWSFNPTTVGSARPGGRGSIVFDSDGNLYWRTTLGNNKLSSVTPGGVHRWNAQRPGGGDYVFGSQWSSSSPIVGANAVYALGAGGGFINGDPATPDPQARPVIAAFSKATGARLWETFLPENTNNPSGWTADSQWNPILHNGKLFVIGQLDTANASFTMNFYQIDAATGAIDWSTPGLFWFISGARTGTVSFAPDLFGAGIHGIFINSTSGSGTDTVGEMYAIRVDTVAQVATNEWQSDGGHVARCHSIFNPFNNRVYTHTFSDYGATMYSFDALAGTVQSLMAPNPYRNHGFYDVGALGWDNNSIIAGSARGALVRYTQGETELTQDVYLYTDDVCRPNWYGEYRVLGQLLKDSAGNSIVVTGTNSRVNADPFDPFCAEAGPGPYPELTARMVVLNADQAASLGDAEDGPAYFDDIEVLEGPDLNTLTTVFSENFEALNLGDLPGQNGWVIDNLAPSGVTPGQVVSDPTGGGQGKVAALDAAGNGGGWQGISRDVPDATGIVRVVRWKQWRTDLKDNLWIDTSPNFTFSGSWLIEWDSSETISHKGFSDSDNVPLTKGEWQTVSVIYDGLNVTIDVDGVTSVTPDIDFDGSLPLPGPYIISAVTFELEGTGTTDPINIDYNAAMVEYNTGVDSQNGFTLRGGPLAGPDGKIYYFHNITQVLYAIEPEFAKGDSNCDGNLNGLDVAAFTTAQIGGESAWDALPTSTCNFLGGNDMNNDFVVDENDIDAFVSSLLAN